MVTLLQVVVIARLNQNPTVFANNKKIKNEFPLDFNAKKCRHNFMIN